MSELPQGWETAALVDFCERLVDGSHNPPQAADTGKPMLSARNVNDFRILFDDFRLISDSDFEVEHARTRVTAGDVLITIVGTIGRTAVVPMGLPPFALQRSVAVLKPRGIDSRYLAYAMNTPDRQQWLIDNAKGTAQKGVYLKTLGSAHISVAPAAEQTRIVEKLEELLSDLDAGVAELKAAQKKLGQYRQSLLKAAVEGALTAEWRKQNVPFETGAQLLDRILLERRARWEAKQLAKFKEQGKIPPKDWQKKYPEPVQPDTTNLPELPEGWVWAKVAQTGEVQLGRQRAPQYHAGSNMVPYLRVANVFENRIDISDVMEMHFSEKEEQLFKLHANDILLNEGQSLELVGRPAIYRNELPLACFTNTIVRFRAEDGVIPEFALTLFLHYMHSGRFRKIATITTNIAHLGAGRFAEVEFPLPSTEEQREIMSTLTETMENLVRQQDAISLALKQSTAQRQNILRAAFAGQLVPQDPTDEPASVLLERIRAERAAHAAVNKPRGRKVRATTA
jgi:type I restriction enzyme S subunit